MFISSTESLSLLKNEFLRKLISSNVKILTEFYFRYDFLPRINTQLHDVIERLLNKALVVSLITDIWEKNGDHRLGLGAILTFDSFEREILILGIEIIDGSRAELIKETVESIVNAFKFDKSKIKVHTKVCTNPYRQVFRVRMYG